MVAVFGIQHVVFLTGANVDVQLRVLEYDDDIDAPYVEDLTPSSGATLVATSTNVEMHIKDFKDNDGVTAGSGVDLASVFVTISYNAISTTYDSTDPEFTASGIAANRTIIIDPATDFPADTQITVSVEASDLHSPANAMATFTYSFRTAPAASPGPDPDDDSTAPTSGSDDERGGRRGTVLENILRMLTDEDFRDILRLRRLIQPALHAGAPLTPFCDVPAGTWYEEAVAAMLDRGIVDDAQECFRPAEGATRAEVAKLLVLVHGDTTRKTVSISGFDDVDVREWYAPFIERAAERGWMLGYNNCFGSRPCVTKPAQIVTRAEAAALILRSFRLQSLSLAPVFADLQPYAWYAYTMRAAADHCILQGDNNTQFAYPERQVTRAELVTMLKRAIEGRTYDKGCAVSEK